MFILLNRIWKDKTANIGSQVKCHCCCSSAQRGAEGSEIKNLFSTLPITLSYVNYQFSVAKISNNNLKKKISKERDSMMSSVPSLYGAKQVGLSVSQLLNTVAGTSRV